MCKIQNISKLPNSNIEKQRADIAINTNVTFFKFNNFVLSEISGTFGL